jgi:drug/metabolite transporter (DMT)-like permease
MSRRAWLLFGAVALLWGMPYLLIKVAIEGGVPPGSLAWSRIVLGAIVLSLVAWRMGTLRELRGKLRWVAVFGITEFVGPFPLIAAAEQVVDSSVAAILIAASPLFVALLALRFDSRERVNGRRLIGLLVGIAGVAALVGIDVSGGRNELLGAIALLVAALGYATGPMVIRLRLSDVEPTATMAGVLAVASVLLMPVAFLDAPRQVPTPEAIAAIVALGVVMNGAVLVMYGALILTAGAGRALLITYVNPLVATALGIALLGERPGPGALLGLSLILGGSWLASRGAARAH